MGKPVQRDDDDSEYETDNGSEESEYETDDEQPVPAAKPASKASSSQKESQPCKQYRVDTTAAKFGTCKCGWPKVDHDGPKSNKAAEALNRLKSKQSSSVEQVSSGDGPCQVFRVDVTAEKFGMCKCGYHQSEHGAKKINPAREALMSLKAGSKVKIGQVQKGSEPCGEYHVDPTAAEFGTCYCGFKKADHVKKDEDPAAVMLRKLKEKNAKANERADKLAAGMNLSDDEGDATAQQGGDKKMLAALTNDEGNKGPVRPAKSCCIVM